jgi:hypothetical protein
MGIGIDDVRVSRRLFVGAGAVGTLGAILARENVFADEGDREEVESLRWDTVAALNGVMVLEAMVVGIDNGSNPPGDTLTLTGYGVVHTKTGKVKGGGTFVNRHPDGRISAKLGQGIYHVTGFNSFVNGGGSLADGSVSIIDPFGNLKRTTGGVLSLNVHVASFTGQQADAVLDFHASLPGGQADTPGFRLTISSPSGKTLFHFEPIPQSDPRQSGSVLFRILER